MLKYALTLCDCRATLEDVVTWLQDGEIIMSNTTIGDPHIMVDVYNKLCLVEVTQASEGNYTCFVGNTRMVRLWGYTS
jgi:hypothetical protein